MTTDLNAAEECFTCYRWYTATLLGCPACDGTAGGYKTFTAFLSLKGEGMVEELDILAINATSARKLAKWVATESGDYMDGLRVAKVVERFGMYL